MQYFLISISMFHAQSFIITIIAASISLKLTTHWQNNQFIMIAISAFILPIRPVLFQLFPILQIPSFCIFTPNAYFDKISRPFSFTPHTPEPFLLSGPETRLRLSESRDELAQSLPSVSRLKHRLILWQALPHDWCLPVALYRSPEPLYRLGPIFIPHPSSPSERALKSTIIGR